MTDLNHASQEKYKDVLLEVAREVYNLVFGANDNALLRQLRDALKGIAGQDKLIVKYFSPDRKLTPPKPPLSAHRSYIDKDGKKKTWTAPVESRPIHTHHDIVLSPSELNEEEAEQRNFIGLACIYDNHRLLFGAIKENKINDSIVPDDEYGAIWQYISDDKYFYEGKAEFMRSALSLIRPTQTPASEQKKDEGDGAYIPYTKAIELSNGILTRKKLDKAINQSKPIEVRSKKPRKNRRSVHIQDVLSLIKKLSENEKVNEEAIRMFSKYKEEFQKKTIKQTNLD